MDLDEAWAMGRELLDQHDLRHWDLSFDRAKRRAGLCRYDARTISLSRHLTALHSPDQVRDTVLHEVAHALAGAEAGHGPSWRATARRIGASTARTLAADAPMPPAPWQGHCPAGHQVQRFRRPSRPVSCSRCCPRFCLAHLISWTREGDPLQPSLQYRDALAHASWRAVQQPACPRCGRAPAEYAAEESA
ncbi:MAG TPA: SprT-like domain-containing protein [Beutenbergiaceae bacterium]|nr:SprT-like domain-containing protein [Beutenbergiaceae bacterium]